MTSTCPRSAGGVDGSGMASYKGGNVRAPLYRCAAHPPTVEFCPEAPLTFLLVRPSDFLQSPTRRRGSTSYVRELRPWRRPFQLARGPTGCPRRGAATL